MLDVRTIDGLPTGDDAASWDMLAAADPDATVFHGLRYLRVWLAELGQDIEARTRLFLRDGDVVGGVAEQWGADGDRVEVRFLGGTAVTDYLGPIAPPAHRDAVAEAWIDALVADDAWDRVVAGGLARDTGWPDALARHARSRGLHVDDDAEDVCPRIDLASGHAAWEDALPGKRRQELRRKARKLAREVGAPELVTANGGDPVAAVTAFVDLAASSDGDKGRFFEDDRMRAFFAALAAEFGPDGTLRVDRLEIAGTTVASTVSLVPARGGVGADAGWGLYNSAFHQGLAAYAPGMVLVSELVRLAAEEGHRVFDLLRGDEDYKYRLGADERPLARLTLTRPADG